MSKRAQTKNIVYVINDSILIDRYFPEVRSALRAVRDTSMPNTKVALVTFGDDVKTLFTLTSHASAPWNTHIDSFSGKEGGIYSFNPALNRGLNLLKDESGVSKRIILISDSGRPHFAHWMPRVIASGVVVDTIGFDDRIEFEGLREIAKSTGGKHRIVRLPPLNGTKNTPQTAARPMSDILKDSVAADTATLFLVDYTPSVFNDNINSSLESTWAASKSVSNAELGLATFRGENEVDQGSFVALLCLRYPKYKVLSNIGADSPSYLVNGCAYGSTDIDNALRQAHATISAATAANKRVVLITDGLSAVSVQSSTVSKYGSSGVILDVVAWGAHADRVLLKSWATTGGGNFSVAQ